MENEIKYDNRDDLYKFLIDEFGATKLAEEYHPETFGNFFVTLATRNFLIRYVNDRSFLRIELANKDDEVWYDLSYIKDLITNENINSDDDSVLTNVARVKELNQFLKNNFQMIGSLFSNDGYESMKKRLDSLLKERFYRNFPK